MGSKKQQRANKIWALTKLEYLILNHLSDQPLKPRRTGAPLSRALVQGLVAINGSSAVGHRDYRHGAGQVRLRVLAG
jgi:hypothetical protein